MMIILIIHWMKQRGSPTLSRHEAPSAASLRPRRRRALACLLLVGRGFHALERLHVSAPGGPLANLDPSAREHRLIEGRPVERLRAGAYTYVRVIDDQNVARWVVTMGRPPEGATRVQARTMAHATDFHSQRLQRRFDELYFGTIRPLSPSL